MNERSASGRRRAACLAIAIVGSLLWAGSLSLTLDRPTSERTGGATAAAADPLAIARASLAIGEGPAQGLPMACDARSSVADLSCSTSGSAVGALPSPPPAATGPKWSSLPSGPTGRYGASMALDALDHYVVLFGGASNKGTLLGDTWKFVGGHWTQLHPAKSPPARVYGSMTYDAKDRYVLLFGGVKAVGDLADTWTFAHGSWSKLTLATHPDGGGEAGLTYDANDSYVVLFGVDNATLGAVGQTWTFVAGAWTLLHPSPAPSARTEVSLAYDTKDGWVVMFGGINTTTFKGYNGTWNFSKGTWHSQSTSPTPSARYGAAFAYDALSNRLILFGGANATTAHLVSDTWSFVGGVWTFLTPSRHPSNRFSVATADGNATQPLTLFGGYTATVYQNDTWTFRGTTWTHVPSNGPLGRHAAMLTYDETDGYVLLFGGYHAGGGPLNDTWSFSHGLWKELFPKVAPPARYGGAMAFDAGDGYVLLFGGTVGGSSNTSYFNDTWTFSAGVWARVTGNLLTPEGRSLAQMVYDDADGYVLLYGGQNMNLSGFLYDTWTYSAGVWNPGTSGPKYRSGAAMVWDSEDGFVLLFGGEETYGKPAWQFGDTWTYQDGNWTNISLSIGTSPSDRTGAILVDDVTDGYVLLYGGSSSGNTYTYQLFNDTWEFSYSNWAQLTGVHAPGAPVNETSIVYDATDGLVLLFGGVTATGGQPWTTWEF